LEPNRPPVLGRRFDVITAHQICFNGHKIEKPWGVNPGGIIALEFNEEPVIGFYTKELRKFFESKSARIFRGRVILSRDNLRSQLPPRCEDGGEIRVAWMALTFCYILEKSGTQRNFFS
jgi:hypothetical protein